MYMIVKAMTEFSLLGKQKELVFMKKSTRKSFLYFFSFVTHILIYNHMHIWLWSEEMSVRICHCLLQQVYVLRTGIKISKFNFSSHFGFRRAKNFDMACMSVRTGSNYVMSVHLKVIEMVEGPTRCLPPPASRR